MIDKHTMTTADVARALGLGPERIRELDADLQPVRLPGNNQRRYDPARVTKVAAARAKGARP